MDWALILAAYLVKTDVFSVGLSIYFHILTANLKKGFPFSLTLEKECLCPNADSVAHDLLRTLPREQVNIVRTALKDPRLSGQQFLK